MVHLAVTYSFHRNNHLTERQKQGKIIFIRKLKRINHLKLKDNTRFNLILPCEMQRIQKQKENFIHHRKAEELTHNI